MSPVSNLITCLCTNNKHIRRLQQLVVASLHNHAQYTNQRLTLIRAKPMVVYRSGREAYLSLLAVTLKGQQLYTYPSHVFLSHCLIKYQNNFQCDASYLPVCCHKCILFQNHTSYFSYRFWICNILCLISRGELSAKENFSTQVRKVSIRSVKENAQLED